MAPKQMMMQGTSWRAVNLEGGDFAVIYSGATMEVPQPKPKPQPKPQPQLLEVPAHPQYPSYGGQARKLRRLRMQLAQAKESGTVAALLGTETEEEWLQRNIMTYKPQLRPKTGPKANTSQKSKLVKISQKSKLVKISQN